MIENLSRQEIEEILKDNVWGHLGCNDGFNTYVYPLNYLYDGKYITCHSQAGSKILAMRKNTRVCFQVDNVKSHKNWKSVMVLGEYQEVNDEQGLHDAMKAFADRRMFLKTNDSTLPGTGDDNNQAEVMKSNSATIFRIDIDEKNGRCENE